jgi:hypothetical protein
MKDSFLLLRVALTAASTHLEHRDQNRTDDPQDIHSQP